jgi:hypothetical protein
MEMMQFMWAPKFDQATSTFVFAVPLGDGAIPMIHLDDLGEYARWIFDHPDQSAGKNLEIATQHVHGDEIAHAFTNVTGKKAVYQDTPLQTWLAAYAKEGASSAYQVPADEAGVLTWRESFTGWGNVYRHSGGQNPILGRDYQQLDKVRSLIFTLTCGLFCHLTVWPQILPKRVRSIEEWMRKVAYNGEAVTSVLKDLEDKAGRDRFQEDRK